MIENVGWRIQDEAGGPKILGITTDGRTNEGSRAGCRRCRQCPVPRRSSRSTSFPLQMASHKTISNRKKGTTEEKRQGKKARMAERRQNNRTAPRRRRRRRNATRLCKAVKTNHPGAVCTPGWPLRPPVAALGQGWLQLKGGELGLVLSTASPGDRTASKSNAGAAGHSVPLVPWPKWPGW